MYMWCLEEGFYLDGIKLDKEMIGVGHYNIAICDESESELAWSIIQWNRMECNMHIWVGVQDEVGKESRFTGQFTVWTPPHLRKTFSKLTL